MHEITITIREITITRRAGEKTMSKHDEILVESPAGAIELSDAELGQVRGGAQSGNSVGCNTKTCVTTRGNSLNPCGSC